MQRIHSVLWELATGSVPFPAANMHRGFNDRLNALRKLPQCPADLDAALYDVLSVALQHDPKDRGFSDGDGKQPPEPFLARGMEKALQRFADDHLEKRRRTTDDATRRVEQASEDLDDICGQLSSLMKLREDALALQERIISIRKDPLTPEDQIDRYNAISDEADNIVSRVRDTLGRAPDEKPWPRSPAMPVRKPSDRPNTSNYDIERPKRRPVTLFQAAGAGVAVALCLVAAYAFFVRRPPDSASVPQEPSSIPTLAPADTQRGAATLTTGSFGYGEVPTNTGTPSNAPTISTHVDMLQDAGSSDAATILDVDTDAQPAGSASGAAPPKPTAPKPTYIPRPKRDDDIY